MGVTTPFFGSRNKRRRTADDTATKKADGKRDGTYHCDYCNKDLTDALRIRCAVCSNFDLCLDCFSVGVEITPHTNDHAYRVVDNLSFPIYTLDWNADEELLLLEAVELYGLGSWIKVGEHVRRSPEECKSHYMTVYIETDCFPQPKPSKDMANVDIKKLIDDRRRAGAERVALAKQASARRGRYTAVRSTRPDQMSLKIESDDEFDLIVKDEDNDDDDVGYSRDGGINGQSKAKSKKKNKGKNVKKSTAHQTTTTTPAAAIESSVAANVAGQSSTPTQQQQHVHLPSTGGKTTTTIPPPSLDPAAPLMLSEAQQTGYHVKRNEFELDYDPEAEEIIAELDFPEDEPEETTQKKLRMIEIYNRRLDERHRRHEYVLSRGLLNIKRQQVFDRRRAPTEKDLVGRMRVLGRYLPQPQWDALADGIAVEARLRARIAELQQYRSLGMQTFEQVDRYEASEGKKKKKKDPPPAAQVGKSRLQRIPFDETAMEAELDALDQPHAVAALHAQHSLVAEGKGADGLQGWRTRRGVLLDVAVLPDIEPLTQKERQLCATERYLPAQFLAVKAEVARMQSENGRVSVEDVQNLPFLVDRDRSARLHSFFLEQEWIRV